MSAPTKAEQIEEFAASIQATEEDLFDVWFENHASAELCDRLTQYASDFPNLSRSQVAISVLTLGINSG